MRNILMKYTALALALLLALLLCAAGALADAPLTDEWQEVTGECLVSPDAASLDFVIFSWRNGDASFEIADFTIINE